MVKEICKDVFILGKKSAEATADDIQTAKDLTDTLAANEKICAGMAANMIGINKRIIAINTPFGNIAMLNPVITKKSGEYETEEGCLSLEGKRKTKRYEKIEVEYTDINMKKQQQKYVGWLAQVIQHECDHLEGILI